MRDCPQERINIVHFAMNLEKCILGIKVVANADEFHEKSDHYSKTDVPQLKAPSVPHVG